MPVYELALVNSALAAVVVGGVGGLLLCSVVTQHLDPGCAEVRLRRRSTWGAIQTASLGERQLKGAAQEVVLG